MAPLTETPPPRPHAAAGRGARRRVRRLSLARWSTLHRWLGIGLGLWFALVGVTGTLLVWRDEVDAWLNPAWFRAPASSGPALPVDELIERVRAAQPSIGRFERLRFPDTPGQALRLQVRGALARVEAARLELFVDPATGAVLGQRGLDRLSLTRADAMRTLYEFHRNVLLGEPGSNIVGVAGCLLLTSAISGLVLAWPRSRERWKGLLRIAWRSNATRVLFDVHRSSGTLLAVLVLLATITGTTLVWPNYVRDAVAQLSRVEPIPVLPFSAAQGDEEPLPLQALLDRVRAAFPGQRVVELRLSERGLTGVLFQLRDDGRDVHRLGDTIVWLHPLTGAPMAERSTRTRSAGERFMHWLLPLHVGSAFGSPGRLAMAVVGLAPFVLVGTGLWVWWKKQPGERVARERQAERQAIRRRGSASAGRPPAP